MIYKITGQTGNGKGSCGHKIKAGENYFIIRKGNNLNAICEKCAKNPKTYNTIKIPQDLEEGRIPIK